MWIVDGLSRKKILMCELEGTARRLARELSSRGVRPGDVLTLLDISRIEAPALAIACWLCGAVFNTMDPYLHQVTGNKAGISYSCERLVFIHWEHLGHDALI